MRGSGCLRYLVPSHPDYFLSLVTVLVIAMERSDRSNLLANRWPRRLKRLLAMTTLNLPAVLVIAMERSDRSNLLASSTLVAVLVIIATLRSR